jgi:hypothetical protein
MRKIINLLTLLSGGYLGNVGWMDGWMALGVFVFLLVAIFKNAT